MPGYNWGLNQLLILIQFPVGQLGELVLAPTSTIDICAKCEADVFALEFLILSVEHAQEDVK